MNFTRQGDLVEIDNKVRIEPGPRLVTLSVTPELHAQLLAEVIAAAPTLDGSSEIVLHDAKANPIVVGGKMQRNDWDAYRAGEDGSKVFYLYVLRDREEDEAEGHNDKEIWGEAGIFDTEEDAISAGLAAIGT